MRAVLLFALSVPAWPQTAGNRAFRLSELKTPAGYEVSVHATVVRGPRHMAFGPNGVLYVAARGSNSIVAIPEAGRTVVARSGLAGPHTLVFRGNDLYVALDNAVVRFRDAVTESLVITGNAERLATLPAGGQHTTRTLAISAEGDLLVAAGSTCNFCRETDARRAAVTRYNPDGSGERAFAAGLRNTVGMAWHPVTGELWAVDNGGDDIGEDAPPEEINIVREGAHYGWPDCYGDGSAVSPRVFPQVAPGRCEGAVGPELAMQAHSAPLGIAFYTGDEFPLSFRNDALVAFHGSWNRSEPTGYKVVRVRAASGRAAGIEDFLWGFLDLKTRTRSGRPVQAITGPDGAVYVSDDANGNIYRVAYVGPRIDEGGITRVEGNRWALTGRRLWRDGESLRVFAGDVALETVAASESRVEFLLPAGVTGDVVIRLENDRASDEQMLVVE